LEAESRLRFDAQFSKSRGQVGGTVLPVGSEISRKPDL